MEMVYPGGKDVQVSVANNREVSRGAQLRGYHRVVMAQMSAPYRIEV